MPKKTAKIPSKKLTIGGVMYLLLFSGASGNITGTDSDNHCGGSEIWAQKVLIDKGADDIVKTPQVTTVSALNAIVTDTEQRSAKNPRLSFEKQVITVHNVLIRAVLREDDNDYHLVVQDRQGHHLIAEIPDPDCPDAKRSDWVEDFAQARDEMDKYGTRFQHYEFDITGVPFRDRAHGQTGRAENNLEIHPVLKLRAVKKLPF